ncbi:MAG: DNA helicase RecG, partial [Defluviitaleaceae bacterium]|nr:DNA helicase RecG [Defluviitaleaceae bacterium]
MLLSELSGVGAKRTHALQSAGIFTVTDLLNYFPRDYDDRSNVKTIAELTPDAVNTIRGTVAHDPESANLQRKGGTNGASAGSFAVTKVIIKDKTGTLELIWFNQPYL